MEKLIVAKALNLQVGAIYYGNELWRRACKAVSSMKGGTRANLLTMERDLLGCTDFFNPYPPAQDGDIWIKNVRKMADATLSDRAWCESEDFEDLTFLLGQLVNTFDGMMEIGILLGKAHELNMEAYEEGILRGLMGNL